MRPFESQADLRRAGELLTGLTLRIALVESLGVDVIALGQAPEACPALDDIIRTALARAVAGGARWAARSRSPSSWRCGAPCRAGPCRRRRAAGLEAVRRQLGAAQLSAGGPVLGRLVDGWLGDLESLLGGIKDAEIDPRFVEGVIVEVKRS